MFGSYTMVIARIIQHGNHRQPPPDKSIESVEARRRGRTQRKQKNGSPEYRGCDFTNPASLKRWAPCRRFRHPIRNDRSAHRGKEQIPGGRQYGVTIWCQLTHTPESRDNYERTARLRSSGPCKNTKIPSMKVPNSAVACDAAADGIRTLYIFDLELKHYFVQTVIKQTLIADQHQRFILKLVIRGSFHG